MHQDTHAQASAQLFRDAQIKVVAWKPLRKNTLLGFCDLELPSGLVLKECSAHQSGDKQWIGLPAKPQLDKEGHHRIDSATGKKLYLPLVEFSNKRARDRFTEQALAALTPYIGGAK